MNQTAVPWTDLPHRAWNVLEHLEMSLAFEDECFRLVNERWIPVSEPFNDGLTSYAQSTMKALIETGVFEFKTHDNCSFLFLTERGYQTVKSLLPMNYEVFLLKSKVHACLCSVIHPLVQYAKE